MSARYIFNVVAHRNVSDPFGLIRRDDAAAIDWAQDIADGFSRRGIPAEVIILREDGHQVARIATATAPSGRFRENGTSSPNAFENHDSERPMTALAQSGR